MNASALVRKLIENRVPIDADRAADELFQLPPNEMKAFLNGLDPIQRQDVKIAVNKDITARLDAKRPLTYQQAIVARYFGQEM